MQASRNECIRYGLTPRQHEPAPQVFSSESCFKDSQAIQSGGLRYYTPQYDAPQMANPVPSTRQQWTGAHMIWAISIV